MVMGAPPLLAGAVHHTTDWALLLAVAVTPVGAPGKVDGVAGADGAEAGPVPMPLVAVTVNLYATPLVKPVTVQLVVVPLAVVQVWPPLEVTVYLVRADPFDAAAVQDTTDWVLALDVAFTAVGAPGTVFAGTTALDALEEPLVPAALVAVTLKV